MQTDRQEVVAAGDPVCVVCVPAFDETSLAVVSEMTSSSLLGRYFKNALASLFFFRY